MFGDQIARQEPADRVLLRRGGVAGRLGAGGPAQLLDDRHPPRCPAIVEVLEFRARPTQRHSGSEANLTDAAQRTTIRYSRLPEPAAEDCMT